MSNTTADFINDLRKKIIVRTGHRSSKTCTDAGSVTGIYVSRSGEITLHLGDRASKQKAVDTQVVISVETLHSLADIAVTKALGLKKISSQS